MKKLVIVPSLLLVLLLMGCPQQPYQTEYPGLETGIYLAKLQIDLQQQYDELYPFVSESEQRQMRREVAPLLNNLKHRVHAYNTAVKAGTLPPHSENELRMLARQISVKIFEVQQ